MVRREQGFTYLTILFVVAIMSTGLALAGEMWQTSRMREKEAELLFVGHQYRQAIARYYLSSAQRQYPRSLSDLLQDPRQPGTIRHLRRLYADPLTGSTDWGLVKAPDGGIAGVHSLSVGTPLRSGGFRVRDAAFEEKTRYSDWHFVYAPAASPHHEVNKP